MSKEHPIEIFMPPNVLKAKVGTGGLDISAVKRAEAAIEDLKEEFSEWMAIDVDSLVNARKTYATNRNSDTLGALYRASHDLKGQGATFDFPLVARVAASLCKLTDDLAGVKELPLSLVDAHVNAIKVIVRDQITNPADAMASVLAGELERQVLAFVAKAQAA